MARIHKSANCKSFLIVSFLFLQIYSPCYAASLPRVEIRTSMGTLELELFSDKAPVTVENFLYYVITGYFDGMIFHRVVDGWLIQAGGYDKDLIEWINMEILQNLNCMRRKAGITGSMNAGVAPGMR